MFRIRYRLHRSSASAIVAAKTKEAPPPESAAELQRKWDGEVF